MVNNIDDIVNAELEGRMRQYNFRKTITQTTVSGYWFDMSMSPGNPVPKYWFDSTPNIGVPIKQSTDGGIYHGGDVTPATKYLRSMLISHTSSLGIASFRLLDYILYYPSIDDSVVGDQTLTNNFNTLCTFTTPTPPTRQDNILTLTSNNLANYTKCRVSSTGTLPSGLTADTDYWSIRISDTTCKLATSRANALANNFVTISDSGTGIHSLKTILPRHTDGKGVQMMAVSVASRSGGYTFNVTYTNQDGVDGRVSKTVKENAQTYIGVVATSMPNADGYSDLFIPLQEGDTGVQSIQSVNMITGDVGLISIILVKPLAELSSAEQRTPIEKDFFLSSNKLPEIKDDAFLGLVCLTTGSMAAELIHFSMKVIWN